MQEELETILSKITNSTDLTNIIAELFADTCDIEELYNYAIAYSDGGSLGDNMHNTNTADVEEDNSGFSLSKWITQFGVDVTI